MPDSAAPVRQPHAPPNPPDTPAELTLTLDWYKPASPPQPGRAADLQQFVLRHTSRPPVSKEELAEAISDAACLLAGVSPSKGNDYPIELGLYSITIRRWNPELIAHAIRHCPPQTPATATRINDMENQHEPQPQPALR